MPSYLLQKWRTFFYVIYSLFGIMSVLLAIYAWPIGILFPLCLILFIYIHIKMERFLVRELTFYLATISHRVRRAGNEVINEMPLGILLYSEEKRIDWHNPFIGRLLSLGAKDSIIGDSLFDHFSDIKSKLSKEESFVLHINESTYLISHRVNERLLYFHDISVFQQLQKRYENEKIVMGIIMLDNLDELTQALDDQSRNLMFATVSQEITEWAMRYKIYVRRVSADKFILILNKQILRKLEQSKFDILDTVREKMSSNKVPMTLSIGVGAEAETLIELGKQAQAGLDMALGRGGDQVAVKEGEKVSFFGGKSNAIEKRTKVRVRVTAHALRDLIKDSTRVIAVGHKVPDMDAVGAAIGIYKAAKLCGKESSIVLEGINPSIKRLMDEVSDHESLSKAFVTPEQALELVDPRTLVVVVDTHKSSMLYDSKIIQQTNRVVIIDHHRRGEEIIPDAMLVYIEPYASSTSELITELLQYMHETLNMGTMEATALLAGIVVDTKNFTYRTGSRTFEAASFLRRNGADSTIIQRLFREDLSDYLKKADLMRNTEVVFDQLAVVTAQQGQVYSPLLVAQVADALLNMTNIAASFVISERPDGLIGISARSAGSINVQLIMEKLGGGGHFTNAAVQLDTTTAAASQQLKSVLERIHKEEGKFA